jgi:hypothetical protein
MLEQVEGWPAVIAKGDDLTVNQCVGLESFTSPGDPWKLPCKFVSSARPDFDSARIFAG